MGISVGVVGLGIMGGAIVEHIARESEAVYGYDIDAQAKDRARRAGVLHDYFLYERQGEARIAGDCLARVSVESDRVSLEWDGVQLHSEPACDPFKQVESLLHSLPIPHWTAFGYVAFDLAKYYHPYSRAIERPLLQFHVPRFEVRIGHDGVSLHGGDDLDAAEKIRNVVDRIAHSGCGTTLSPTPPTLTYGDRQDYCDKVKTLTLKVEGQNI